MHKFLLCLILLLPLLSCDKEADFRSGELQAPVVSGFQLIDENRAIGPTLGKPNDKAFKNREYSMGAYPNFVSDVLRVDVGAGGPATAKMWLVRARTDSHLAQYSGLFNASPVVIGGTPLWKAEAAVNGSFGTYVFVSELPEGAYRLYVQINDELAWQNIWINRQQTEWR